MTTTTYEDFLAANGYRAARVKGSNLELENALSTRLRFSSAFQNASRLLFLLRTLGELGKDYGAFAGALLWITDVDVGPPGPRSIALQALESQRRSYGEVRSVQVSPVHLFEAHEFELSLSLLTWLVLGDLHGHYYPHWEGPEYMLRVSGDSYIELICEEERLMNDTRSLADALKLSYGIPASS